MKIVIIGAYPPPLGGVSVHIQRLFEKLSDKSDTWILDPYQKDHQQEAPEKVIYCGGNKLVSTFNLLLLLARKRPDIVHFHMASMRRFLPTGLIFFIWPKLWGGKNIITIHGGSFAKRIDEFSPIYRFYLHALCYLTSHIIAVNKSQKDSLRPFTRRPEMISVIPAFSPPKQKETPRVSDCLTRIKDMNKQLIITSGYGIPLYGFHTIIRALENIDSKKKYILTLCLYNEFDDQYLAKLQKIAAEAQVEIDIMRNLGAEEFSWLLARSDLFIRATTTDGDAISLREAIYHEVPVIASDCVERPSASLLFETENPQALQATLEQWADSAFKPVEKPPEQKNTSSLDKIIDIYEAVCTNDRMSVSQIEPQTRHEQNHEKKRAR